MFETDYEQVLKKIDQIDPIAYAKTRNFADGAVTRLSPYISRGVISTQFVLKKVLERGFKPYEVEKFIQELAWRDYWQQVWLAKGDAINKDLKSRQTDVEHGELPVAIHEGQTGIHAIDEGIQELKETGYMHNHMRMYVAATTCNIGKSHWRIPAQWMYYYLLDGDWASNALSWQWVAGSNAGKKYYANQGNINKFFYSKQRKTFLDVEYESFPEMECPKILSETFLPDLTTPLSTSSPIAINPELPTLIYTYYNLDPQWRKGEPANRILLLEPSTFKQYPVSKNCINFAMDLGSNISGLQVYAGEFNTLIQKYKIKNVIFKEHPLNNHYQGQQDDRDWMFGVKGYFSSFFGFWKRCKREMKQW